MVENTDKLKEYVCPNCGGAMVFDSTTQNLKCQYCDTEIDIASYEEYEAAGLGEDSLNWKNESKIDDESMKEMYIYHCNACGGEIIADKTTGATRCPFCGNPVVMSRQFAGDLKPDWVLPFKLDKEAAKKGLLNHLKGKKLLPSMFEEENYIDEIKGIYVPYWLFDASTSASARYHGTRIRTYSDANYVYTETKHYALIRSGTMSFEKIPVDASSKMEDSLMESLEPFDYSEMVDFETAYLAGYLADKYDVSLDDSIQRANQRLRQSTENALARTVVGYSSVYKEHGSLHIDQGQSRYALLPIWLLNTTYKDKKYTFAMNGQTGKFIGDLPCDMNKFWKEFMKIAAIVFGVIYLVCLFALGVNG